ncbi:hypothetical protein QR680_000798 [Steinernema hermaphroditum]|uniref:JNK-interacting protein 1 n=1 Tax=Steinernema hermaphroditum TaxID=289476 RepID=A0AA39GXF8_9BILA|nr:hypothetical protein QR680_000798 [Steinernema hermaphroditum]
MDFDDDDDEDIEELVRKMPLTHSRSAHARLSRQNKISSMDQLPEADEDASSEDEEDSDEEFYVHQCLLPLRKSKSDHSFSASRQASVLAREQFQNIYDSFKQYELACSVACEKEDEVVMMHSPEASLAELNRHLDVIWPSPDNNEDEFARTEHAIAQGLYKEVNPELLELVNRLTERRNSDVSECWSAPGNFYELDADEVDEDQPFGEQRVTSCWSAPDMSADYQKGILEDDDDDEMAESDYNESEHRDDDEEEIERRRRRSLPYFRNRLERSCSADDIGTQRMLTMNMTNSLFEECIRDQEDYRYTPDPIVRFRVGDSERLCPRVIIKSPSPLPSHLYRDDMERSADLCESFDTSTFPSEIVRCEIESPSSDEEAHGDFPLDSTGNTLDCCLSPSLSSSKSETHLRCMLDAGRPRSPFFDHQHPENADLDVPDEFRSRSESNAQLIISHDNVKTMRQSTSYHCGEEMLAVPNVQRCTSPACRSYSHPLTKNVGCRFTDEEESESEEECRVERKASMQDLQQYHRYYEPSASGIAEQKLRKSATSTGFQGNAIVPPENGQRRRRRLPKRPDVCDSTRLPMSFSCYDQSNAITFDEAERIWMAQSIEQFRREQAAAAAYEELEKSGADLYARPQDLFLGHPREPLGVSAARLALQTPRNDGVLNLNQPMWNEKKESNLQCSLNGPADLNAPRHVNKPAATTGSAGLAPSASSSSSRPTKQPEKGDGEGASEKCATISVPVEQSPRAASPRANVDAFAKMSSGVDTSQRMPVRNDASLDGGAYCDFDSPISPPNILPSPARGHRRLPPLPIKSSSAALLSNLGRPFQAHFAMPTPPSIHTTGAPANGAAARSSSGGGGGGGTQLCFGMETSAMFKSTGGMEDSYYEEDGLNGNQHITTIRQTSFFAQDDSSGVSSCCTGSEHLNPTHRVQSTFIPRHDDEVLLEIGDAVHVERESEDHWCYGTNLRTHQHGIFPSAHVCEIDIVDEICMGALPSNATKMLTDERDTFYLTMLASIEVAHHKGNDVLVQAMNKNKEEIIVPQTVLMEISFRGIHIIDKRKKNFFRVPTFDFFYSLQNISFCGAHPKQLRYFGFITKHPLLPRFACHVFLSNESTQAIVESIGRAFKRSYDEYMAFAHPTEDIYIE